jgi:hypothetical protein
MSVVKSSFRIVFSRGYISKCMAVTDFPYSTKERIDHMSEAAEFKIWAIVEVTGHVEDAGFVTAETIAGLACPFSWERRGYPEFSGTARARGANQKGRPTRRL